MYQVLENDKPADCKHCKVHDSWHTSKFATFEEALKYARKWLGQFGGSSDDSYSNGIILEVNKPYLYSGYGDSIEIRETKE